MNNLIGLVGTLGVGTMLALCPCCSPSTSAQAPTSQTAASGASVTLRIEGMTCASCQVAVKTALERLDGVKDAKVSSADKRASVDYDPAKVTPQQLVDAVNKLGYEASLPSKGT